MGFIMSTVIFIVSAFLLAVSLRYGLKGADRLDDYFSQKNNSEYPGFEWYYRIPFSVGVIPEYFYALVLTYESYFKKNWWPLKTASFISVLVFIATLKSRSAVYAYFSFDFVKEGGISALFTSGNFVNFMNIIVLLYVGLFVLLCIESIKMHGVYSPVRILVYSFLSFLMADLTVIVLSVIVFITVLYVIYKIIKFLFFSSRRRRRKYDEEDDEDAGTILKGGFREFKTDLYQWEEEESNKPKYNNQTNKKPTKRKRPKITRRRKKTVLSEDDVPRLHPN